MKKFISLVALILICVTFVFAQEPGEDQEPVVSRTAEIISYVVNVLLLMFSPKLVGVFNKIRQVKDLLDTFLESLSDGDLTPTEQKTLATKFKAIFSK